MFFGGITDNKAVQVWKDVAPPTRPSSCSGLTVWPSRPSRRRFRPPGDAHVHHQPDPGPEARPAGAQDFFKTYKEKFGETPEPYAIYGYEAMQVALLAIQYAGDKGNDRQAVIDQFFKIKDRDSVLGKYSIDPNGDTTLSDYGGDKVKGGQLVFDKVIKAQTTG